MESSLTYDPKTQSFYCSGCMETEAVRKNIYTDQDKLLEFKEMMAIEHSECPNFKDPVMARQARKFRKEAKRRQLLEPVRSAGCFRA
jgi:hypothetical protein